MGKAPGGSIPGSSLDMDDVLNIVTVSWGRVLWCKIQDFMHDRQML